jgi:hypothetical protein
MNEILLNLSIGKPINVRLENDFILIKKMKITGFSINFHKLVTFEGFCDCVKMPFKISLYNLSFSILPDDEDQS